MKKFFIAFLGTLAGIWFSLFIAFIGVFVVLGAAMASSLGSTTTKIEKGSVLLLNLSGQISDRPGSLDIMSAIQGNKTEIQGLNDIVGAITAAADDDRIDGIVIDCNGVAAGAAQRQAIVEALKKFKEDAPEKWIYSYSDSYTQGDYYIASTADSIFLNPIGQVDVHGLSATTMYFKNLMDKLGVEAQVVKVGTYKSAVEPFLLSQMSDASREQQQLFLDNIWGAIKTQIAEGRKVTPDTVNAWANGFTFADDVKTYLDNKMIDALTYRHEFDEKLMALTGKDDVDDIPYIDPATYCKDKDVNKKGNGKGANIAVLYATGDITDNDGEGIVAAKLVPEIMDLTENEDIDGLIMYVNSGGGSAFASEQIWEALEQFKAITGKPFYVSMADYAASGGYYISCGADKIFAQPTTLTGSIGIFGIIPNANKLVTEKIGVTLGTVQTNPNANFPTLMEPMTPTQKAAMQSYVERGYDLFTSRCAEGRGMSQDSIKMIAEGRVWDGAQALKLGLVDMLGGLDMAIAEMAKELNVETYTITEYPTLKPKWYDAIVEAGADIKAGIIKNELGECVDIYETVNRIKGMSTLQCRMDYVTINM